MTRISSLFYRSSRSLGRTASELNDVETLLSGNPEKNYKKSC